MGLERFLSDIAPAMASAFADEEPWSYHHVATDTHLDVTAFLKWKSSEQDPYGAPTKRQKVPVVRAMGIPPEWEERSMPGDTVTAPDGRRFNVNIADHRPSGWCDLYVDARG